MQASCGDSQRNDYPGTCLTVYSPPPRLHDLPLKEPHSQPEGRPVQPDHQQLAQQDHGQADQE
jgi:hypothetical protein